MQVPAIGRIVIYRFPDTEGAIERPAIIVHVWGDHEEAAVQLQVFCDTNAEGTYNDGRFPAITGPVMWKTSVTRGFGQGQYHFHDDPRLEAA